MIPKPLVQAPRSWDSLLPFRLTSHGKGLTIDNPIGLGFDGIGTGQPRGESGILGTEHIRFDVCAYR